MHTVARATTLIGCTRTTVYKYLKKDLNRYGIKTDGQIMVTDQGLELLKSDIAVTMKRVAVRPEPSEDTAKTRLKQSSERISILESEIVRLTAKCEILTVQHDNDQRLIQVLEQARTDAQKALDQEQQLRLHELAKPSWIRRLFGKKEP